MKPEVKSFLRTVLTRGLSAVLSVSLFASSSLPSLAAVKTMPDGGQFDAQFYAATYPDVAAGVGTDEAALYQHYLTFGAKEGRLPYAGANDKKPETPPAQPQSTPPAAAGATAAPVKAPASFTKKWGGSRVSILGDSISTFGGCQPEGYVPFYPQSFMPESSLTWWMQTIRAGGMKYVIDASWTGTRVTGDIDSETGNPGCSIKRAQDLSRADAAPNLIFILMGANDFLSSVTTDNFAAAYGVMLDNIKLLHPGARIVCLTCTPIYCLSTGTKQQNELGLTIDDYNARIKAVAASRGVLTCDTNACGINGTNWEQYLGDGLHPNAQGMALIASYIVNHL